MYISEKKTKIRDLVYIPLFTLVITLCSWLTVPFVIPFTMQTFGIFLTLYMLGARRGFISVFLYIALGLLGVPVFSGFNGGVAVLFGATGGYITGFLLICAAFGIITSVFGYKSTIVFAAFTVGLLLCYSFGTLWYVFVYTENNGSAGFIGVLSVCVLPFVIFDILKMVIAIVAGKRILRITGKI